MVCAVCFAIFLWPYHGHAYHISNTRTQIPYIHHGHTQAMYLWAPLIIYSACVIKSHILNMGIYKPYILHAHRNSIQSSYARIPYAQHVFSNSIYSSQAHIRYVLIMGHTQTQTHTPYIHAHRDSMQSSYARILSTQYVYTNHTYSS